MENWKQHRHDLLRAIENDYGVELPDRYREFVICPSALADEALTGSDYSLGTLRDLQEGARELLAENDNPFELRPDDFVILMHQGYQFFFIPCDCGDDPPVFYWLEGQHTDPERRHETFSEWLTVMEAS